MTTPRYDIITRVVQVWFALSTVGSCVVAYTYPEALPTTPISVPAIIDAAIALLWVFGLPDITTYLWNQAYDENTRGGWFRPWAFLFIAQANLIGCNVLPVSLVLGIVPTVPIAVVIALPMVVIGMGVGWIYRFYKLRKAARQSL